MKRLHGPYGAANLSLEEEKEALRKRMRKLRKRLAFSWSADVSPALTQSASETPTARRKVVAGYFPQGSEADPISLINALVEEGWTPALPRASNGISPLTFHAADDPLAADAFGIPAPLLTAPRLRPDLVLVPLLAFDRSGRRLGQGAGCYDLTIAVLRAAGPVRVIGLAYAGQEVEHVPTATHDQPLDGILTDRGFIEVVHASP